MSRLLIALAQLNFTVGDIDGNCRKILAGLDQARAVGVDVVAFPELAISGYPPEDLLLKPGFIADAARALEALAPATKGLTAVIGVPHANDDLYNAAAIFHDGRLAHVYYKHFLPNYGVFDENRYFQAGTGVPVIALGDVRIGVSICEDIWYPVGPPEVQAMHGSAHVLLNISASPYSAHKGQERERMLATRAADNLTYVAYCNLVGGQDELVFDGQSVICGPTGAILARGPQFEEAFITAELDMRQVLAQRLLDSRRRKLAREGEAPALIEIALPRLRPEHTAAAPLEPLRAEPLDRLAEVYGALVLGTRDYVRKNGFQKVIVALSGGIDSSLVAAIAADALGPANVIGVSMPTRYSSQHSLDDARQLAENFGLDYRVIPIDATFQSFLDTLAPQFAGTPPGIAEENIQARVRGSVVMALSNKFGWLVLTTGNKSEVAVGYSTLYGDTAGGFAVIKDVPKTMVYELCRWRNTQAGRDIIPQNVLVKPPSAELRPNQKDSDSLPEYDTLDPIIHAYVEEGYSLDEIIAQGHDPATVRRVMQMIDRSEYKRRQNPPGVKILSRAFGKDWRLPITNAYRPYK